jgi:hypothetical protein
MDGWTDGQMNDPRGTHNGGMHARSSNRGANHGYCSCCCCLTKCAFVGD